MYKKESHRYFYTRVEDEILLDRERIENPLRMASKLTEGIALKDRKIYRWEGGYAMFTNFSCKADLLRSVSGIDEIVPSFCEEIWASNGDLRFHDDKGPETIEIEARFVELHNPQIEANLNTFNHGRIYRDSPYEVLEATFNPKEEFGAISFKMTEYSTELRIKGSEQNNDQQNIRITDLINKNQAVAARLALQFAKTAGLLYPKRILS